MSVAAELSSKENIIPVKKAIIKNDYVPGDCNIGKKEITRRKIMAVAGIILTLTTIILIQFFHAANSWRLLLFPTLTFLIINIFQVNQRFCVFFGIKGIFNFNDLNNFVIIKKKENLKKDRLKAWKIITISLLTAFIVTLLYYFLPV